MVDSFQLEKKTAQTIESIWFYLGSSHFQLKWNKIMKTVIKTEKRLKKRDVFLQKNPQKSLPEKKH